MSRDATVAALDRIGSELGAFIEVVDRDKLLDQAEAPRSGCLSVCSSLRENLATEHMCNVS